MENKLTILYEDNHVIVVLKPRNVPSQGDSTGDESLCDMVNTYLKTTYGKKGEAYVGLVHRLDRPTGGVMVFAKSGKAAARLSEQIREGAVEKCYLAVVHGRPRDERGLLTDYLVKDEKANMVRVVPAKTEDAKLAQLSYRVTETAGDLSLVDIKLLTGRSHQARVQLAHIGHPIYGDQRYGGAKTVKGAQLALWAYRLRFEHPVKKVPMVFVAYPPEEAPWDLFSVEKHVGVFAPH